MRIAIFTLILILSSLSKKSDSKQFKRDIVQVLNPNCGKTCSEKGVSIFYVKATSEDDVLHYLYSAGNFTETLSVVIIRSQELNSSIDINYQNLFNNFKKDVVNFKGKINGSFGLIFTNLYEYNDIKDVVKINDKMVIIKRPFDKFQWIPLQDKDKPISFKSKSMNDSNDTLLSNGMVEINFTNSGVRNYSGKMPNLIFTGNNTHIDFILDNLISQWDNSRFAVEVALINDQPFVNMNINSVKSIDDEMSPGVFRINNFNGQNNKVKWENSTYLQWKPVCYLNSKDRSLNSISVAYYSDLSTPNKSNNDSSTLESSLAFLFFGDKIYNGKMSLVNISFGLSGDKFYKNSKYLIWASSFGQGIAPIDSVSVTVIMVIAFGLGLPFVLVVIGSIYLIIKKRFQRRQMYVAIEDPINS